jgi:hypothetical protein
MKKSIWIIALVLSALFITSQIVTGCGSKKEQSTEEHEHAKGDTTNHHHDETEMDHSQMAYACPMHPEVTGKEGDTCSKCGMKLEPVKERDSTEMHDDH